MLQSLYETIDAPRFITTLEAAEMIKYADMHFMRSITFAKRSVIFARVTESTREVMEIFVATGS